MRNWHLPKSALEIRSWHLATRALTLVTSCSESRFESKSYWVCCENVEAKTVAEAFLCFLTFFKADLRGLSFPYQTVSFFGLVVIVLKSH